LSHLLVAHALLAATTKATKSSGSQYTLLIIVALFGLVYFLVLRPRSQKQRQARAQVRAAVVGDEIATIGGLVGTIVAEDGDRVTVSTGNGTELVFLRQAIGKKLTPPAETAGVSDAEGVQFEGPPPGFGGQEGAGTSTTSTDETTDKEHDGT
jgi:preprotein translocase subunit YajC